MDRSFGSQAPPIGHTNRGLLHHLLGPLSIRGGLVDLALRVSRICGPSKLARWCFSGGGLVDLSLRASNEGLLRPRVARAQEID